MPEITFTEEQKKQLFDTLVIMSYQERHCYLFHTVYLYTYQEIADIMKISKSSVQKYMERAKKKIKGD